MYVLIFILLRLCTHFDLYTCRSNVVLVVNGVDLEEVTKFIFAFKMYSVPEIGLMIKDIGCHKGTLAAISTGFVI